MDLPYPFFVQTVFLSRPQLERELAWRQFHFILKATVVVGLFTSATTTLFQPARISLFSNFLAGLAIGSVLTLVYLSANALVQELLRRQRSAYLTSVLANIGLLLLSTVVVTLPFGLLFFPEDLFTPRMMTFGVAIASFCAILVSLVTTLSQFSGRSVVAQVYSGRYRRPRLETRVVLFVDIKASTTLAEDLGSEAFFDVASEFHHALETYARYFQGTIYKYMGDGEILVWPPEQVDQALRMLLNFNREFDQIRQRIAARHGRDVVYTSGLHLGPCVIGEIGFEHKEIGYWGDTVNTTQRIQDACKRFDTSILVSETILRALPESLSKSLVTERLENVALRGKETPMMLYRLGTGER